MTRRRRLLERDRIASTDATLHRASRINCLRKWFISRIRLSIIFPRHFLRISKLRDSTCRTRTHPAASSSRCQANVTRADAILHAFNACILQRMTPPDCPESIFRKTKFLCRLVNFLLYTPFKGGTKIRRVCVLTCRCMCAHV